MKWEDNTQYNTDKCIIIYDWMMDDLGLSGSEMVIYSIIYNYNYTHHQYLDHHVEYLLKRTHYATKTVYNVLDSLISKGLVEKREYLTRYDKKHVAVAVTDRTQKGDSDGAQ